MDAFGVAVSPETSAPPYARTHILVTDLAPQGGSDFHGSTVMDNSTPRAPEGTLLLRDAWRHVLGGGMADQDHDE